MNWALCLSWWVQGVGRVFFSYCIISWVHYEEVFTCLWSIKVLGRGRNLGLKAHSSALEWQVLYSNVWALHCHMVWFLVSALLLHEGFGWIPGPGFLLPGAVVAGGESVQSATLGRQRKEYLILIQCHSSGWRKREWYNAPKDVLPASPPWLEVFSCLEDPLKVRRMTFKTGRRVGESPEPHQGSRELSLVIYHLCFGLSEMLCWIQSCHQVSFTCCLVRT